MNRIETLEREADRARADFTASLRKLRRKLTPLGLADEALRKLDPHAEAVVATGRSLRRNPLPALSLLVGLGWLALNAREPEKPTKPKRKARSLIPSQKKENHHEDNRKTQNGQGRP